LRKRASGMTERKMMFKIVVELSRAPSAPLRTINLLDHALQQAADSGAIVDYRLQLCSVEPVLVAFDGEAED